MRRDDILWLVFCAAVATALGLVNILHQPAIEPDGTDYVLVGQSLVERHVYPRTSEGRLDLQFPPLYPFLCGVWGWWLGDLELGGRAASLTAHVGLVLAVFLLARRLAGGTAARWASALAAVGFAGMASLVASEMLYTTLLTFGTVLVLTGLQGGRLRIWAGAGAVLGAAYLARIEGFLFLALASLAALLIPREAGGKTRVAQGLALAAAFLLVASPFLWILRRETGRWTASTKFVTVMVQAEAVAGSGPRGALSLEELDYGLSEDNRTFGRDRRAESASADTWGYLRTHTREVAVRYASNLFSLVWTQLPATIHPLTAAFAGMGLVALARRADRRTVLAGLGWPFLAWLAFPLARVEPRFLAPHVPILMACAGAGLEMLAASWGRRAAAWVGGLLLAVTVPQALAPMIVARWRPDKFTVAPETKVVGRWLREHGGTGSGIMARRPVIPFYAEGRHVPLPHAPSDRTLAFATHRDVRFLVLEEDLIRAVRPHLAGWLDSEARLAGWRVVYRLERRPGYRYLVWERSRR